MVINLKNKLWVILIFIIIISIGIGIYFFTNDKNTDTDDYTSSKTASNQQNTTIEKNETKSNKTKNETNIVLDVQNNPVAQHKTEEPISSFSTKIYNKESSRQNNINITCSTLNETTIPNGSTFSFCNTVGEATSSKGYQKADIFDKDGNKKKGLGGGNCQVSTTLYNAALQIPSLVITERHAHSNKVPYIQTGKDAAVAYGSYDLKFKNNTGYDIKIKAQSDQNSVIITLYKII